MLNLNICSIFGENHSFFMRGGRVLIVVAMLDFLISLICYSSSVYAAEEVEKKSTSNSTIQEFKLPDGLEWQTNLDDPPVASPQAKPSGTYYSYIRSFPPTFRQVGPNSNSGFRGFFDAYALKLVDLHPTTLKFIPKLATHWAPANDNKTVYYKLNPKAKWSDGTLITAEDYVYTLKFMRSEHIVAPWYNHYYTEELDKVVVHSPDVISVVSTKPRIEKVLIAYTSISPIPRTFHKLDKNWVSSYNWKVAPVSGAYRISSSKHGQYITFKKVKNWWGQDHKYFKNMFNFETIHLKVIRDPEAVWQNFMAGKLHYHGLTMASYYHEKATGEEFDKGYIKKIWTYTDKAHGLNIMWINTSRQPWDDVNVRKAFAHALNFDKVNKELLRNEYVRLPALYTGYKNYDNPTIKAREFDITKSTNLMKQAGWSLGQDGYWQKDGSKLEVNVLYGSILHQDRLLLLKEEAKKAGFDIVLNLQQGASGYKLLMQKNFDVRWGSWGGGDEFGVFPPVYWEFFHSDNAKPQTNNSTMTASPELDKLIDTYRDTFDVAKKQKLSQEILQFIYDDAAFIPGFINPFVRFGIWRHIQIPELSGFKDPSYYPFIQDYGWVDEKVEKELKAYQKAGKSFGKTEIIDETYKLKPSVPDAETTSM